MLKKILLALICLEFVLLIILRLTPANATMSDLETFIWDFASVSSKRIVCKQIVIHPKNQVLPSSSDKQAISISSRIVDDSYCAALTKISSD